MSSRLRARLGATLLLALSIFLFSGVEAKAPDGGQRTVVDVESLGLVTFETGTMFKDTEVGGLSGITWDPHRGLYYALSDDRTDARFYTVTIDLSDGSLDDEDVVFVDVTTLLDETGAPFAPGSLDPEGINMPRPGQLFISSEGDADADPGPIDPFVNRFSPDGEQNKAYPVPDKFLPDGAGTFGIRDNLAFESLTSSPNRRYLYTASESALAQDGPISTLTNESMSRILKYRLNPGRPVAEYVYMTGAIPAPPDPPGSFADNGLPELAALDDTGTLLALERSFAVGVGNTIRLFEVTTQDATDVSGLDDLYDEDTGTPADFDPAGKRLIVDLEADLGLDPDNVEGMTFGPILPDGRQTLILVSDNNFNPGQITQFIALALEIETIP